MAGGGGSGGANTFGDLDSLFLCWNEEDKHDIIEKKWNA